MLSGFPHLVQYLEMVGIENESEEVLIDIIENQKKISHTLISLLDYVLYGDKNNPTHDS